MNNRDDSDSHGPMDSDSIGAAAALEAFKQTAAQHQSQGPPGGAAGRQGRPRPDDSTSSNAPAGGFRPDRPSGGQSGRPTPANDDDDDEDEEEPASRAAGGGGMQDKIVSGAIRSKVVPRSDDPHRNQDGSCDVPSWKAVRQEGCQWVRQWR